jgi:diguanylate cyclase (GGDEF)-like protein
MPVRVVEAAAVRELEAELARERQRRRTLEEQLRNLADHDPLTDLLNRRSIEHELELHQDRCERYGPEGAFLLVAVGGLADITRDLGERHADEALVALAERVAGRLRTTDVIGRFAPDELAVLLPRAGAAEAALVSESLVQIVGATGTPGVRPGSLAATIGVALMTAAGGAGRPEVTLEVARRAVAVARRRGGGWAAIEG